MTSRVSQPRPSPPVVPLSFEGLDERTARWMDFEQTLNERLLNDAVYPPMDASRGGVPRLYYPDSRTMWEPRVVWLPSQRARRYGPVSDALRSDLGLRPPRGRAPLILHPQAPASHQRLAHRYRVEPLAGMAATTTSSFRSVLAWRRTSTPTPVVLKLSLGAVVGRVRRVLREGQIARSVVISSLLDTIPVADRDRLGLDWFPEPAGVAETRSQHGWLLRRLPRTLAHPGTSTLLPVFSLLARRGAREPMLVSWIARTRLRPEAYVLEQIIEPYVKVLSFLLFDQGLQYEGHPQNVLFDIGPDEHPTGRLVLRDLSDTTVNISLRVARGRTLPVLPATDMPEGTPFSLAANAADYTSNFYRSRIARGYDTVEVYGLRAFVWSINTVLARHYPTYDAGLVERRYLERWQQAAVDYLRVRPLFRAHPQGMATDEAVAFYLRHVDWRALGATRDQLPSQVDALKVRGTMRKARSSRYDRISCAWGDLFISDGLPGFLKPSY